jgi:hypothetical protein
LLEFAALLLVSTLFGGMMLYSFGFAPMVFRAMPAEEAGRFIRAVFPWYYLFVIAIAGLGGAILLLWDFVSGVLMIAIAAVAVYARQGLMPQINAAREARSQGVPEAKARFGRLHGISVALNFAQLIAAGYVLYRFL